MRQLISSILVLSLLSTTYSISMQKCSPLSKEMLALMHAIKMQEVEQVSECLKCLKDVNVVVDEHGNTPLHWAVYREREKMVDVLLAHKASALYPNLSGRTPLDATQAAQPEYVGYHIESRVLTPNTYLIQRALYLKLIKITCEK